MGNTDSSSSDGWDYGELLVKKALKVVATGVAIGTIAYVVWKTRSQSKGVEEEENKQATSRTSKVAGGSSASHMILESKSSPEVWSPPPEGYYKLNTDFSGPSDGSETSGIGWLIRDHRGNMVYCGAEQVNLSSDSTDDIGEALALLTGLEKAREKAKDYGFEKVVAETDHEPNVNCIKNDKHYKSNDNIGRIRKARDTWFKECQVIHVDREANRCANHLASFGRRRGTRSYEQLCDSPDLKKLLLQDATASV